MDEADSRLSGLPLPLFGYFLGFLGEGTDDADVTLVNNDFLLRDERRHGFKRFTQIGDGLVSFCELDINPLVEKVKELDGIPQTNENYDAILCQVHLTRLKTRVILCVRYT